MKELGVRGFCDVPIYGGVCSGLLGAICLHDLTGYGFQFTQHCRCRSMLSVHDGEQTVFHWRNNDGGKLGPIKVLSYLCNIVNAPPADTTLVLIVDD
jgi:hypothetical protein